jgi:hypothetical protein
MLRFLIIRISPKVPGGNCHENNNSVSILSNLPQTTGRAETRGLEAASAVGYDGAAIRQQVDNALNKTDAKNAEMKKAMDQVDGK